MRRPIIAGNWKMHGTVREITSLLFSIKEGIAAYNAIDIVVFPPYVYLAHVQDLLKETPIAWGAQNLYVEKEGAFTGEISGPMLVDLGCQYVLVGHSERRLLFHEDLQWVAAKFKAALIAGLTPILCVGETQVQREGGKTEAIIQEQIKSVIEYVGMDAFSRAVIAYEPVWAIGTGKTATPNAAESVHAFIRELIAKNNIDIANAIRILYGGSMKAENAASLLAMQNIDGGLIGGASQNAHSFLAICKAAA